MSIPVDGELMVYGIDDPDAFFESVFCCEGYGYKELEIAGETYYHYYFQFRYQPEGLKDLSKEFDCVIEAYSNIDYDGYILHELYDRGKKLKYEKIKPKKLNNFKPDDGSDFYHADFSDCFEITKQENPSSIQNTSDNKQKASSKSETSKKPTKKNDNTIVTESYSDYISNIDAAYDQCCKKIKSLQKSVIGSKPITRSNDSRINLIITGAQEQMQNYADIVKNYIAALEESASLKDDYDSTLENDISMIIYSYDALKNTYKIEFTPKKTEIIKCPGASTASKKAKVWSEKYDSLPSRAMQNLKDELKEQEKALKQKKAELEKNQVEDENKENLNEKKNALKKASDKIKQEIKEKRESISQHEKEYSDLDTRLTTAHRSLNDAESLLQDKKDGHARDLVKLNNRLDDLRDEREKVIKNRESLLVEESDARTKAKKSFFLKNKYLKEADEIAAKIAEADKNIQEMDATGDKLLRSIEELNTRYNEYCYSVSNRITNMRAQKDELERKISANKIAINQIRSDVENLEETNKKYKKESDEYKDKIAKIDSYLRCKEEVEEAEKQVEETKRKIEEIKEKKKQADKDRKKREKENYLFDKTADNKDSDPPLCNVDLTNAFICCEDKDVKSYSVPEGCKCISVKAFKGCTKLEEVYIPDSVCVIQSMAFFDCISLKRINLPNSLQHIDDFAFPCFRSEKLNDFEGVFISDDNLNYSTDKGVLYSKDKTVIYYVPATYKESEFIIPKSVEMIKESAFRNCRRIRKVVFEGNVEIKDFSFCGCTNLETVEFHGVVKSIGDYAFKECAIKELVLPNGLAHIGREAFSGCRLSDVSLPVSVETLGRLAFNNELKTITVYDSIEPDRRTGEGEFREFISGLREIHNIEYCVIVLSAETGKEKYRVYMPDSRDKNYYDYRNAWGPNASFDFNVVYHSFFSLTHNKDLIAIERLHHENELPPKVKEEMIAYLRQNSKEVIEMLTKKGEEDEIRYLDEKYHFSTENNDAPAIGPASDYAPEGFEWAGDLPNKKNALALTSSIDIAQVYFRGYKSEIEKLKEFLTEHGKYWNENDEYELGNDFVEFGLCPIGYLDVLLSEFPQLKMAGLVEDSRKYDVLSIYSEAGYPYITKSVTSGYFDPKSDGGIGRWAYECDMMKGLSGSYRSVQTGDVEYISYSFPFEKEWSDLNTCYLRSYDYLYRRKVPFDKDELSKIKRYRLSKEIKAILSDGVTLSLSETEFEGRNDRIEKIKVGDVVTLVREHNNQYYANVINVFNEEGTLGLIPLSNTSILTEMIDSNLYEFKGEIKSVKPRSQRAKNAKTSLVDVYISFKKKE